MTTTIFTGATIFHSDETLDSTGPGNTCRFHDSMIIKGDRIEHVGSEQDERVREARQEPGSIIIDMSNQIVLPGFIDGHVHLLQFGLNMQKLDLLQCRTLSEIRTRYSATLQPIREILVFSVATGCSRQQTYRRWPACWTI